MKRRHRLERRPWFERSGRPLLRGVGMVGSIAIQLCIFLNPGRNSLLMVPVWIFLMLLAEAGERPEIRRSLQPTRSPAWHAARAEKDRLSDSGGVEAPARADELGGAFG